MSFKMRGRSIGSIKKSVQEKTRENGEKYYTLQVQDREYVDGKNNTITIFVNIWGKLSDKMKEILSHEGTVIALEGNVNKKISVDATGNPKKYTQGDRAGQFMYDYLMNIGPTDIDLPPRTGASEEASETPTENTEAKAQKEPVVETPAAALRTPTKVSNDAAFD